jgi:hypothetical protein
MKSLYLDEAILSMLVRRNRLKISWLPREPDIAEATLHKTVAGPREVMLQLV